MAALVPAPRPGQEHRTSTGGADSQSPPRRRHFNVLSAGIPVAVSRRVRRWPIFPKLSTMKSLRGKKTFPLHSDRLYGSNNSLLFISAPKGVAMFIAENLLMAIAKILDIALTLYMWVLIARAVISWVNPDPYNPIVMFLYRATEPVLAPVRRWLPFRNLGIDLSPLIVILAIIFLQTFLIGSMKQMAMLFR
jgi:YggT family protein